MHGLRERPVTDEVADQFGGVLLAERLEEDRRGVHLAAGPLGPSVEQLRSCDGAQQDGCFARPIRDVVDEVEERGFRPVKIVQHHDQRLAGGDRLEELADAPEDLLGRNDRV